MNVIYEYQLQVPVTRNYESVLNSHRESSLNQILPFKEKISHSLQRLPRLSSKLTKIDRSISQRTVPQKLYTIKTLRTTTEMDEIVQTDGEQTGRYFKREEKKRKISNYKLQLNENPQYKKLSENLQKMIHQLTQLKEHINNQHKFYGIINQLIGNRKKLKKILIKHGKEELVDFSDIIKLSSIKEFIIVNQEQKLIEKLNINLYDDILYANEILEGIIVQNQILSIKRIADQIKLEKNEIKRLRNTLRINQAYGDVDLSISSAAMSRYNLHEQIDYLEQRLGPLQQIQKQTKQTSYAITSMVSQLNEIIN